MTKPRLRANAEVWEQDFSTATTQTLTLQRGLQIVTVDKNTPFNVLNIDGRTLVNILGLDGNCEDTTKWATLASTLSLDTANKVYGSNSLKVTLTANNGGANTVDLLPRLDTSKAYLFVGEFKNGTSTGALLSFIFSGGSAFSANTISSTTSFGISYEVLDATNFTGMTSLKMQFFIYGTVGQYAYADGFRIYQISAAEKTYIAGLTIAKGQAYVATKYPYADDMKHVQNPYLIKSGKNLLPPFQEWTLHANAKVIDAYKLQLDATGGYQASSIVIPVIENQQYTLSLTNPTTGYMYMRYRDAVKTQVGSLSATMNNAPLVITTPVGARYVEIYAESDAAGTFVFDKPQLVLGSVATLFEPQNNDYLFLNTTLASNLDASVKDYLYYKDGSYVKAKRFKQMDLDGSLGWVEAGNLLGARIVKLPTAGISNPFVDYSEIVIKYDGKILKAQSAIGGADKDVSTLRNLDSSLFIAIDNVDSGWGEDYAPTAAEIQAYFYGWRMYDSTVGVNTPFNGTGTKAWYDRVTTGSTPTLPTTKTQWWDTGHYKLQYQLAQEQEELIQFEGDIQLHNGTNQIEMGEGVIIREKANPKLVGGLYYINVIDSVVAGTRLSNKASTPLGIYKNGIKQTIAPYSSTNASTWMKDSNGNSNGLFHLGIYLSAYDPTAEYTVSYIVLQDGSYTLPVSSGNAVYEKNLKSIVNQISQELTDVATRQSVADVRLDKTFVKGEGERIEVIDYVFPATIVAQGYSSAILSFQRTFAKPPVVLAIANEALGGGGAYVVATAIPVTTTGFTCYAFNAHSTATVGANLKVRFVAIGK